MDAQPQADKRLFYPGRILFEPRHEKTCFWIMRKQKQILAARFAKLYDSSVNFKSLAIFCGLCRTWRPRRQVFSWRGSLNDPHHFFIYDCIGSILDLRLHSTYICYLNILDTLTCSQHRSQNHFVFHTEIRDF